MPKPDNPVLLAQIGAPHGVKGELRVKSFTAQPSALSDYKILFGADGTAFEITSMRPAKNMHVVSFKGVTSREMAEKLNGTRLYVDRASFPDDNQQDEFYITDIIGMNVLDKSGNRIGAVVDLVNFGAGDLLEIEPGGDKATSTGNFMLAFTRQNVPEIDFASKSVTIVRPEETSERDE